MNETAIRDRAILDSKASARRHESSAAQAYLLLAILILGGWLLKDRLPIDPQQGVGYWLGIIGGSAMLALLLYPLRKRIRWLHRLGPTRHWFRLHMVLGLVGPLLVLYHCNFQLGSFNSRVAFYCMLLVAGSGIIGRHFYAAIHRGLYGRRTTLKELQSDLDKSMDQSDGVASLLPGLSAELERMARTLLGDEVRQSLGIGRSLHWSLTHRLTQLRLNWLARRELKAAAERSATVARNHARIGQATRKYISNFIGLTG